MINITTPNTTNTFFVKADSSSSEWIEQSSSTDWSDRRGHCCYEKDGTLFISGGQNASVRFSDIWKSTDNGESWTLVTDTAPFGQRYNHFVLELSGTLFLFGGSNIVEYSDVWSSEDGESWTLVTASWNISGLSSFGACVHNNKLCIAGGYKAPNYSDSFWTSEDGAVWTEVSSNIGLPSDAFNIGTPLFSFNGALYVLSHGEIHKSIDNGLTWSTTVDGGVSLSPVLARAITNGNSIYVSGGYDAEITTQLSDKLWTSEDGIVWTQQVMPCGKRYAHGVFLNSNGFTICGGASSNSPMAYENDIWVLYLHHYIQYIQCPVAEAEGIAVLRYIPVGEDSVEGEVYAIGSISVSVSPLTVVDGMNFVVSGTSVSLKGKTIKIQILDGATWTDCTGTAVIASDGTWSVTANATGITAGATKLRAVVGLTLSDEEDTTFEEVWIAFDALGTITAGTPYTLTGRSNRIGLHLDISQRVSSPEGSWTFIGQAAVQGDGTWSDEVTVADAGTFDLRVEDADDSSVYDQLDDVVVATGVQ
ncbi:MAG TPA: hypothetical protein PK151_04535 [Caldisericia bacterium]|mgnify:FL=1|nr:hypothetical protein [Caldisericia bacterium]